MIYSPNVRQSKAAELHTRLTPSILRRSEIMVDIGPGSLAQCAISQFIFDLKGDHMFPDGVALIAAWKSMCSDSKLWPESVGMGDPGELLEK